MRGAEAFFQASYRNHGLLAQRRYPNEELCRFMGRRLFRIPLSERKSVRILEVGCGSGANLWMIAKEGFDTFGQDLSVEAIGLCADMMASYGVQAQLEIGDMTKTSYPDKHFDVVVDVFSSYCLDESGYRRFAAEVRRLLKPGGLFFTYTPSKASDAFNSRHPSILIDSSTLNGILREDSPFFGNNYPFRFSSIEEISSALHNEAFQIQYSELTGRTYGDGREYFEFVVVEAVL